MRNRFEPSARLVNGEIVSPHVDALRLVKRNRMRPTRWPPATGRTENPPVKAPHGFEHWLCAARNNIALSVARAIPSPRASAFATGSHHAIV
jgi:hypothetical protein